MTTQPFDVLTATAVDLQLLLQQGKLTSVQIVEIYRQHIEKYNAKLHAIISISSNLRTIAADLDHERAEGRVRGPLHGIPIIVKDAFNTVRSLGLPTTVGSLALVESQIPKNATIIDALVQQGLIILGKTNLTEFCGFKGTGGWSAVGGMCQSPYIPGGFIPGEKRRGETAPGGSSTGSAMGVAAGFSPISLGTETSGSLTSPASRAALYALKLTNGSVNMEGAWQVAASFDTAGGMAKSALDLALLSNVLLRQKEPNRLSLVEALQEGWEGISVGFVDIELWRLPLDARGHVPGYNEQSARDYDDVMNLLRTSGAHVVHPVYITPPEKWLVEGGTDVDDLMDDIMRSQARAGCEYYLGTLDDPKITSLQDIIDFNNAHPEKEFDEVFCPNQNALIKAQIMSMSREDTEKNLNICKQWAAVDGVDKVIKEHGIDVIVAPCDSFFAGVGVAAQYPLASIPFSYVESSGRPYGLHVIAKANEEDKIIKFMGAWEKTIAPRRIPDLDAL
ncbi:amidase signature domain-containing protein [Lophiotrema nucula]|uniref:Amidase signature domain-containing protein n=1 Tax=Lophiotrema nucula TaxID=690887 RepID=A0A6A5YFX3_9PLEO|nr:amidase signature domain-containing protein [Lophiotrema nucula]